MLIQDYLFLLFNQIVLTLNMLLCHLFQFFNLLIEVRSKLFHRGHFSICSVKLVIESAAAQSLVLDSKQFSHGFCFFICVTKRLVFLYYDFSWVSPCPRLQILGHIRVSVPFLDLLMPQMQQLISLISKTNIFEVIFLNLTIFL